MCMVKTIFPRVSDVPQMCLVHYDNDCTEIQYLHSGVRHLVLCLFLK